MCRTFVYVLFGARWRIEKGMDDDAEMKTRVGGLCLCDGPSVDVGQWVKSQVRILDRLLGSYIVMT